MPPPSVLMRAQCAAEVLGAAGLAGQLAAGGARDGAGREETHIGDGQTVTVQDCRLDGLDRRLGIGTAGARGTFGNDHQPSAGVAAVAIGNGQRRHVSPAHHRRCVRDGGLDVVGIVVATVDAYQIHDSAGDIKLAVEIHAQVPGPQPGAVGDRTVSVAVLPEPRTQPGAERDSSFVGHAPIAATNIVALQPDFADFAVG